MVAGGIVAPFWGRFLDRHGPRLTIAIAQAIVGTAWLLRSQARSLPVFYASFALAFLGLPGPVLSVPRALGAAFPARKGTVIGFATTGASGCTGFALACAGFFFAAAAAFGDLADAPRGELESDGFGERTAEVGGDEPAGLEEAAAAFAIAEASF